ncbi:hypothetical protein FQ332_16530 [Vibrio diabolicus]|nr:hypothetical protein FQ332_16530 [Vibrio diabolicus]
MIFTRLVWAPSSSHTNGPMIAGYHFRSFD